MGDSYTTNNSPSESSVSVQEPELPEEPEVETTTEPKVTPSSQAPTLVNETPKPKTTTPPSNCDPNYSPCVPNVSYDLDCGDISFSVNVIGSDPHGFDRDNDGYGCESN